MDPPSHYWKHQLELVDHRLDFQRHIIFVLANSFGAAPPLLIPLTKCSRNGVQGVLGHLHHWLVLLLNQESDMSSHHFIVKEAV
jgi:hypothetical protein